jgi:major membrane immunogen (membrane-anchored lipoprotein)
MSKQQTAVDFLIYQYKEQSGKLYLKDIKQAKAMEKEQITSAVIFGVEQLSDSGDVENENRAEQYYNKAYENPTHI